MGTSYLDLRVRYMFLYSAVLKRLERKNEKLFSCELENFVVEARVCKLCDVSIARATGVYSLMKVLHLGQMICMI